MRHQRNAEASSRVDGKSNDGVSQRSFGANSNMTTHVMTDGSGRVHKIKDGSFVEKQSEKNVSFCESKSKRS